MAVPSDHQGPSPETGLVSDFANDADMAEVIDFFLAELQERITTLERAWHEDNRAEVGAIAHQLRGAASGYGYPIITQSAADLESTLQSRQSEASRIAEKIESLISLCRRAVEGAPNSSTDHP